MHTCVVLPGGLAGLFSEHLCVDSSYDLSFLKTSCLGSPGSSAKAEPGGRHMALYNLVSEVLPLYRRVFLEALQRSAQVWVGEPRPTSSWRNDHVTVSEGCMGQGRCLCSRLWNRYLPQGLTQPLVRRRWSEKQSQR